MNVRARLRGAFALYIAMLLALSLYHVRTTRRAVASARSLSEIASRLRTVSAIQTGRLAEATVEVRKYGVTLEPDYLAKAAETMATYDVELHRVDSLQLTERERALVAPLQSQWRQAQAAADALQRAPANEKTRAERALVNALDRTVVATQSLAAASQDAMNAELQQSERFERSAEQATLLAAAGALLLSILLSALLARSILNPLAHLQTGTQEISAGRFGYRLTPSGNDELAQVARDFNSMTERLDELDRMKRDFVSKVSHDLKTPLSSMQETTGAILDGIAGPVTPKQRQLLAINHESGQRLSSMLNKLLDLSRIEAGIEPEMQPIDVRQLVRASVDHIHGVGDGSPSNEVIIAADDPPSHLLVRGDAERLTQVIDNLVDNAVKFSPAGAPVRIRVRDLDARDDSVARERWAALSPTGNLRGAVLVTVADEGPGVPNDEKERIFTRFYQTEAGRGVRSRGVGLGLTICLEIVAGHGGTIWVDDNEPHGSVFHVLLPASTRVDATAAVEPAMAAGRGRPA